MDIQTLQYLKALGIQAWQLRTTSSLSDQCSSNIETSVCETKETHSFQETTSSSEFNSNTKTIFSFNESSIPEKNTSTINANTSSVTDEWTTLRNAIATCTACGLNKTRTQTVFGVGNPQADLMIIGEAPGFYEDKAGEPFVGRAGQLLNAMLQSIGMTRDQVYIANILKCRPPNNRDPLPNEVELCTPFLKKQINFIKPKLLLGLGRIAAHYLLNTKTSLGQLRGQLKDYNNIPLLITYHPAYLLRNPIDKRKTFEDLQLVVQTLQARGLLKYISY